MTGRPPMRRALALPAALLIALGWAATAATAPAMDLPPSQLGVSVYDFANIWSAATEQQAETIVDRIAARTGVQIAVVSWPSGLTGVSTDEAALDAATIGNTWKVGREGDQDGLVVLYDMDTSLVHGEIYLATNKGFRDAYLSDSEAQAVHDSAFIPPAKNGDLDASVLAGLQELDRIIQPGGNPDRTAGATIRLIAAAIIAALGLLVLLMFYLAWLRQGRDAAIPLIDDSVLLPEPPPGLTPAMATVLRRDRVTMEAFTSALVDLGHRGLVTFDQAGDDAKNIDLVVNRPALDDAGSRAARERPLGVAETSLLHLIRNSATEGRLSRETLKQGTGQKLYQDFRQHIGIVAASQGWFVADPNKVITRWTAIGIGVAVAAGVGFWITGMVDRVGLVGPDLPKNAAFVSLALGFDVLVGIGIAVLGRYMAARTPTGAQTLAMALAYRNTLRYEIANATTIDAAVEATKRRLPWITTPDLLTVWAVAFGLNTEIDRLIKQSLEADQAVGRVGWVPLWFASPSGFGSVGSVSGLAATVASVGVTAASSGGGGFGGGGSGGGGGGAGGGF
ncbi:MAG TPA: TPM domain-containing protein [Candidatus Limnocylindrales bacterium]|nr:TPM domain-containing protein [Candidatus Limnocylindrales bacterium]